MATGDECRKWRGDLAAKALGRPDPVTDAALDAHVDGCPTCRSELEELRTMATAAGLADPERLRVPPGVPALADQIVARVAAEAAAARRRRRGRLVVGAVAAAALVAVAVASALAFVGDDDGDEGRSIELAGSDGADGSAVLVARPWGTEVTLEVSGLDDGEVYWLWLTDEDGDRVVAGTLTGTGHPATAVLSAALPTEEARRIWMTDEDDRVVLDARVEPG